MLAPTHAPALTLSRPLGLAAQLRRAVALPVVIVSLFAALSYFFVPQSIADPDIWWHLRNAQLQLQMHNFIHRDAFSFTAANSLWMNHEWLAELPFYAGFHLAGATGLYLVSILAIELCMLGIFALAWLQSRSYRAAFIASTAGLILSTVSFGPRTLLFGWILLIAELLTLHYARKNPRAIWLLPPIFLLWINTHGSWLIGLVLFFLWLSSGLVRFSARSIYARKWPIATRNTFFAALAASIAALFINPYGWRLVLYPFDLAFRQTLNTANVEEWHSVDFHSPRGKVMLLVLAATILLRLVSRRRWRLDQALFFLVALDAGLTYSRFMFLAAILIVPILAADLASLSPRIFPPRNAVPRPLLNAACILFIVLLSIQHWPRARSLDDAQTFPAGASAYITAHPLHGNLFNSYLWGGFIEWHNHSTPVFIDSRVDIFEYNGTFADYLDAIHLKNTLAILDRYQIRYVLFQPDAPLAYFLTHAPGWRTIYSDSSAILLERTP
jgi:hypothetical protein